MEGYIPVGTGPKGTAEGAAPVGGSPDGTAGGAVGLLHGVSLASLGENGELGHSRPFGRGLYRQRICP